jgi:hypothetical protein
VVCGSRELAVTWSTNLRENDVSFRQDTNRAAAKNAHKMEMPWDSFCYQILSKLFRTNAIKVMKSMAYRQHLFFFFIFYRLHSRLRKISRNIFFLLFFVSFSLRLCNCIGKLHFTFS